MKKIKRFFDIVVKSLTSFPYYKDIAKAEFKFSLKYLFFLFYLISLLGSIVFAVEISILILPKAPDFIQTFQSKVGSFYPKDLVITIKDGQVATNVKEPYYIDLPQELGLGSGYNHLITIDTKAEVGDIKDKATVILVTKDAIAAVKDNGSSYEVYPIDSSTNYTIDKNGYDQLVSKISPYLKYATPALIALVLLSILVWPLIVAVLSLGWQLFYLLIFSAIFFILVKLLKRNLKFAKVYQLSMHASTLPILLGFITSSIGIRTPFLLGSLILLIFMVLVINQFRAEKAA